MSKIDKMLTEDVSCRANYLSASGKCLKQDSQDCDKGLPGFFKEYGGDILPGE